MSVITQINMLIDSHEGSFVECTGCETCSKIQALRKTVDKTKKRQRVVEEELLGEEIKREKKITEEDIALAAAHGISEKTLRTRVFVQKLPVKTAATKPMERQRKFTKEEVAIAAKNGISYHTLMARCNKGWDKQKAMTDKVDQRFNKNKGRATG